MDIKTKIEEILLTEYQYIDCLTVNKLLDLFVVSGRSEQLVCVCKNRQDQFKRNDVWICGDCEEEIKQTNCH